MQMIAVKGRKVSQNVQQKDNGHTRDGLDLKENIYIEGRINYIMDNRLNSPEREIKSKMAAHLCMKHDALFYQ